MMDKFRTVDRNTLYLLPPPVRDWLPEDRRSRFVKPEEQLRAEVKKLLARAGRADAEDEPPGKAVYARRNVTVSWNIKETSGLRRFSLRGLDAAS